MWNYSSYRPPRTWTSSALLCPGKGPIIFHLHNCNKYLHQLLLWLAGLSVLTKTRVRVCEQTTAPLNSTCISSILSSGLISPSKPDKGSCLVSMTILLATPNFIDWSVLSNLNLQMLFIILRKWCLDMMKVSEFKAKTVSLLLNPCSC